MTLSTITPNAAGDIAARLLWISQQQAALKKESDALKEALNTLYATDGIAAKSDVEVLFSDGTYHKVRLQRKATGTYFKVLDEFKDDFSADKHRLEAKYLKAEKATMAEKASTWVVQEVKA